MHQNPTSIRIRISHIINSNFMRQDFEKLFSYLKSPEPPAYLLKKIMAGIHEKSRLLSLKQRLVLFSLSLLGSLVAFVPALQTLRTALTESGFIQFLSLLFSDAETVIVYWQNFVYSLLETLPVMSLAIFLTIFFIFLGSLKLLTADLKTLLPQINHKAS